MRRAAVIVATLLVAPAAHAGSYRWPTTFGIVVTAGFDNHHGSGSPLDWSCGGNSYSGHRGTDIGVPRLTDVFAGANGYVKDSADGFGDGYLGSTDGGGFGNHVAIFHGGGDETIYGHMTAGTGIPGVGTTLACSDMVGKSGSSGNVTGPHLHFETRVGVDEAGSYYSGSADDPYMGPCSGPLSYWVNQNGGQPTTDCAAAPPPPDMCGSVTAAGECAGTTERHCVGGAVVEHDCAADLQICQLDGSGNAGCVAAPGVDADGDGVPAGMDCDDTNAAVHPGATETCNGVDDDCSGAADENLVRTCCSTGTQTCGAGAWGACSVSCADPGGGDPGQATGGCTIASQPYADHPVGLLLLAITVAAVNRRRCRGIGPRRSSSRGTAPRA